MNNGIVMPTRGPWWVMPNSSGLPGHLTITSKDRPVIATVPPDEYDGKPNFGNAALMAAGPQLLEALCEIQMLINARQAPVTTVAINQIISNAFEKIHIEADV